jgi:hypothetical protein
MSLKRNQSEKTHPPELEQEYIHNVGLHGCSWTVEARINSQPRTFSKPRVPKTSIKGENWQLGFHMWLVQDLCEADVKEHHLLLRIVFKSWWL